MSGIRTWKIIVLATSCALGGCAGLSNGAPPVFRLQQGDATDASSDPLQPIRDAIQANCLQMDGTGEAKAERNRLVTAYMFGIDAAYHSYERQLLDAVRENDLGASSASMALSTIGAVVGSQALAQALSTTNAIVTGTHTAIGRDYLFSQTLTTLQTQMRASRASQRAIILERLRLGYDQWDSCTALSDVLVYEQAGTLNAALAEIAASANRANTAGQDAVQRAIPTIPVADTPSFHALDAYVFPEDETLWESRLEVALRVLRAKNLFPLSGQSERTRLMAILNFADPEREADRRALMQGLVEDPSVDEALKAPLRAALGENPFTNALQDFVFPDDESLWESRIGVALRVVRAKNLLPLPGLSERTRLMSILNFADPNREADRDALIQGIIDDPAVDETLKAPLRAAIGG